MIIYECRVPLPLTVQEYQVGQLYTVAELSKQETHGDAGVEILKNEPYDDGKTRGQYTRKVYHLGSRVPSFIRALAPSSALRLEEEAWNAYPYCKTVLRNEFLGDRFTLTVSTWHMDNDKGTLENVHKLPSEKLSMREVDTVDIGNDAIDSKEYRAEYDPKLYKSKKTGRGPLVGAWKDIANPMMCAYKLAEIEFRVWGLQSRFENWIMKFQRNLFLRFHKQVFCLLDEWFGLTMSDIRQHEDRAKNVLKDKIEEQQMQQKQQTEVKECENFGN